MDVCVHLVTLSLYEKLLICMDICIIDYMTLKGLNLK